MKINNPSWLAGSQSAHLEKWISTAGGMAGILAVMLISNIFIGPTGAVLIAASMGASAVLLFAVPHGPLSQPWPVLGGHTLSALIGVCCAQWIPDSLLAASTAVALAIAVMHYLLCLHPPGGATALTAVVGGEGFHALGFHYVLTPVLISAMAIVIVAIIFNFAFPWRRYPASLSNWYKQKNLVSSGDDLLVQQHDLDSVMKSMNRVIDISSQDLNEIYQLAQARSNHIEPMQLSLGQTYSNDLRGNLRQVRQIIDIAVPKKSPQDVLIYKVIAGHSLNRTGAMTREEFSLWARQQEVNDVTRNK